MVANELRIGNLVLLDRKEVAQVDALCETLISVRLDTVLYAINLKRFEPIELTEEWLLEFGWVWNEECRSYEKYPNGDVRTNLEYHSVNCSYTMFNYVIKALIAKNIQYVHQLQNLYFALTGEELTLKP